MPQTPSPIKFEEPPAAGRGQQPDPMELHIAAELRKRPGKWAILGEFTNHYDAALLRRRIRRAAPRGAWSGSYDVTIRKVDDRLWKVYVRARDTDGSSS